MSCEHLVLERRTALFLLDHPVVAADALVAALLDREPRRLAPGQVDVAGDRVAGLVDRDRAALHRDVLEPIAVPASSVVTASTRSSQSNAGAAGVVRDRQRHRDRLLDHRRRVAAHDPRDLVAARRASRARRSCDDLPDVEVEDVEPILLGRRPEPDVAAHATRPDQRRIEPVDRDVRGADEVDLVVSRPGRRQPQLDLADRPRDDVRRVEERVELARGASAA